MPGRRPYQDWSCWQHHGSVSFWRDVLENTAFVGEVVCQRLAKGGLVNPSESTSADVATGILVATHGPASGLLQNAEIDRIFDWVKVPHNFRQKVLRSSCPRAVTTARGLYH
jgi:hypothetical protein